MDKIVNISYAAVYAVAQAIATFAQIRADQVALSTLSDSQLDQMTKPIKKAPIGFAPAQEARTK